MKLSHLLSIFAIALTRRGSTVKFAACSKRVAPHLT